MGEGLTSIGKGSHRLFIGAAFGSAYRGSVQVTIDPPPHDA